MSTQRNSETYIKIIDLSPRDIKRLMKLQRREAEDSDDASRGRSERS